MLVITDVLNCGNDVLLVKAEVGGIIYEATGWVSATQNHYDAAAYDAKGNLTAGAKARTMTAAEVGDYALRLILDAHPELAARAINAPAGLAAAAPTPIVFVAPAVDLAVADPAATP